MSDWFDWIYGDGTGLVMAAVTALIVYAAIVVFTRLAGLRSFSKMSSHDFAVTVAFGSLLATAVVSPDPPIARAIVGLASLYAIQYTVSRIRLGGARGSPFDNEPLLLMRGPEILDENLRLGRVARRDLLAKLRQANVRRREQVLAVVLETTGDISVIHAEPGEELEPGLFEDVRGGGTLGERTPG